MTLDRTAARARCETATKGPWEAKCSGHDYPYIVAHGKQLACGEDFGKMPDAEFIAHARTDLPAALDALDAKDKEIERLRDALVIVDEQESRPDFAQWLSVRSVVRHAMAALEGRDSE